MSYIHALLPVRRFKANNAGAASSPHFGRATGRARRRSLLASLILAGLPLPLALRADDWAPNLTAAATWQSNASHANLATDQVDSLQLKADVLAGQRYDLGRDDSVHLTGHFGVEWWPRYTGLTTGAVGARAEWRHRLGVDALAPTFSIEGALDAVGVKENTRGGTSAGGIAALRKRFNDQTRATLSHEVAWFDARRATFDRGSSETSLEIGRDFTDLMRLTFTARFRDGDVLSYASGTRADLDAIAPDREDVDTFGRPMTAYRVDARTWSARIGFLRVLDESTALSVSLEWRQSERKPLRFVNHLASIGIVHQF